MGEIIEFPSNGTSGRGYLAAPESGSGPGVVVIQEWWGLVDHIVDVCDRLAAEGFVALAPDLYRGESTTEPDEAGKLMMAMNLDQAGKDMSGAVDEVSLRAGGDRVGVTGFCMGGGLALVLATQRPDKIKACVPWYGIIPWPAVQPDWSALDATVLGHFAENDGFFNPQAVAELADKLEALDKDAELIVHPGVDHAFFNDTRPEVYDAATAGACWQQSVGFLHAALG
ncbi:MAG: dienelactone hydrolase family protein [Actinomycetota bacterium]|nr:dienelactone hydrolase family protein [Actinomycetota bacterium]